MSISYIISLPELALLAHFCGYRQMTGIPELPIMKEDQADSTLENLAKKGLVSLNGKSVTIDPIISFIIGVLASPELMTKHVFTNTSVYLNRSLGLLMRDDVRAKGKYIITPIETARELADLLYETVHDGFQEQGDMLDLLVFEAPKGIYAHRSLDRDEIFSLFSCVYETGG